MFDVQYQPTACQPADLLTKPLPRAAFELHSTVVMGAHPKFRMGISKVREYPDIPVTAVKSTT